MGVQTKEKNMTKNATTNLKRLARGTKVVSKEDAEPGTILRVSTYQRNGVDAYSYEVQTAYGREVWHRSEMFVPTHA